jgi:hypothetical protein
VIKRIKPKPCKPGESSASPAAMAKTPIGIAREKKSMNLIAIILTDGELIIAGDNLQA